MGRNLSLGILNTYGDFCLSFGKGNFSPSNSHFRYGMYWEGSDTISIYINVYDAGNLFIPLGMRAKQ